MTDTTINTDTVGKLLNKALHPGTSPDERDAFFAKARLMVDSDFTKIDRWAGGKKDDGEGTAKWMDLWRREMTNHRETADKLNDERALRAKIKVELDTLKRTSAAAEIVRGQEMARLKTANTALRRELKELQDMPAAEPMTPAQMAAALRQTLEDQAVRAREQAVAAQAAADASAKAVADFENVAKMFEDTVATPEPVVEPVEPEVTPEPEHKPWVDPDSKPFRDAIGGALNEWMTVAKIEALTGFSRNTVVKWMDVLVREGFAEMRLYPQKSYRRQAGQAG